MIFKRNQLLLLLSSLLLVGCSNTTSNSNSVLSSNVSQNSPSKSSSEDKNNVFIKTFEQMDTLLGSCYGGDVSITNEGNKETYSFDKSNDYILISNSSNNKNAFLKTDLTKSYFYNKNGEGFYDEIYVETIEINDVYSLFLYSKFNGMKLSFDESKEITFLNRSCTEYTIKNDEYPGGFSLVFDNRSNICFKAETDSYKYEITTFKNSTEAKSKVDTELNKIKVSSLHNEIFESIGFAGNISVPNVPLKYCKASYKNDVLDTYVTKYQDRTCMGNDSYINQFETFCVSLYELGFNKSNTGADASFNSVYKDLTHEEVAEYTFEIFAVSNSKKYSLKSSLKIDGGQAYINLEFNSL